MKIKNTCYPPHAFVHFLFPQYSGISIVVKSVFRIYIFMTDIVYSKDIIVQ